MKNIYKWTFFVIIMTMTVNTFAQTNNWYIKGELWARGEYRNGLKTLNTDSSKAAFVIDQRTRLGILHESKKVDLYMAFQDARTWGVSGANSIGLYEGWLRWRALSNFNITIGRQEIKFDRERILGALDWAPTARVHDAIRFSWSGESGDNLYWQTQLGATYNQPSSTLFFTPLNIPNGYRTMQYFWGHLDAYHNNRDNVFKMSVLAMNHGTESAIDNRVYFEQTIGGQADYKMKRFSILADGYIQTGTSTLQQSILAWTAGFKANYIVVDKENTSISLRLGTDFLSGTPTDSTANMDNSFNPIFGTNHGIYGVMDYFYAGVGHGEGGLWDNYVGIQTNFFQSGLTFRVNYHYFRSPQVYDGFEQSLGHEFDFYFKWTPKNTPNLILQGGYSQMLGTELMEQVKPMGRADRYNGWAWIMMKYVIWTKLDTER